VKNPEEAKAGGDLLGNETVGWIDDETVGCFIWRDSVRASSSTTGGAYCSHSLFAAKFQVLAMIAQVLAGYSSPSCRPAPLVFASATVHFRATMFRDRGWSMKVIRLVSSNSPNVPEAKAGGDLRETKRSGGYEDEDFEGRKRK
jgi:hypothetical protein